MQLKSVERGAKRLWFGLIRAWLRIRPTPPMPDWSQGARRVLFLRQDRIGDAIVSTGLLRAIASLSPDLELDVLASPRNAEILRRLPYVRHVHVFDKKRFSTFPTVWRALRAPKYEAVIDCMVTAPSLTGLLLMLSSGAPHRLGVGGRGVDWGLTVPVPPEEGQHIIELLSAFIRAFGVEPSTVDWRPALPLRDEEREWAEGQWAGPAGEGRIRRVLANVSAGEQRRAWPDDRYVEVVRELMGMAEGLEIMVVGAPSEWERTASIAEAVGARAVATPELGSLLGVVATADLVFTPDTSVVHVAAAFRKPIVAMYIQGTSSQWAPYGTDGIALESESEQLVTLEIAPVIEALRSMVQLGGEAIQRKGAKDAEGAKADLSS